MSKLIKNKLLTGVALLSVLTAVVVSCTDNFDSLNTPSNQLVAEELEVGQLGQAFAYAQWHGMKGLIGGGGYQIGKNLFADLYAQYYATTAENFESDQYVQVGNWARSAWNYLYNYAARNIQLVEEGTAANDLELENAITKVWRVQTYHRHTDYWGPIIYSEYGNGELVVHYDSQEDIYRDFFTTLDEAVSVLSNNVGSDSFFASHDLVYGGNVEQWLKYANSLRLRLAMRVRFVEPGLAQTEAEKAISAPGGVIEANADNAVVATTDNNVHPFDTMVQWREFRMSAAMESILLGYDDPRIEEYFEPAEDGGGYEGLRNGQTPGGKGPDVNLAYSDVDIKWHPRASGGQNPPIRIISASEVYLLRAEGALLGWNMGGGTAQEYYELGIRRSLEEHTPDADIDAYISSSNTPASYSPAPSIPRHAGQDLPPLSDIPVAFSAGDDDVALEQIITQKWIALYPDGFEAWSEFRRTGFPRLYPIVESANSQIPEDSGGFRRMTFVDTEYSDNAEAVNAAVGLLNGPDSNRTRLWWDANPAIELPW